MKRVYRRGFAASLVCALFAFGTAHAQITNVVIESTGGSQSDVPFTFGQVFRAGAVASGRRVRYSPQLFFFRGPFGGWAEYVRTEVPVTRNGVSDDIAARAWQVAASWAYP